MWGLVRHGARVPNEDDVQDWIDNLPSIREQILEQWANGNSLVDEPTIEYIDLWSMPVGLEDSEQLTDAGWDEHQTMGQRWRDRLGDFFDYSKTEVRCSHKQRCIDSGRAYTSGLFGSEASYYVDDYIARFYDFCPKFIQEVDKNDNTYIEEDKFEDMVFDTIKADFTELTGVELSKKEIRYVWAICRYETAWNYANLSPWCNLFNEFSLKALEFREDLGYYYSMSYPFDITLDATQPVWHDLISRMKDVELGAAVDNSTVFIFSHSSAANPFMSTLGLYRDPEILTAADWPAEDRLWKSAQIGSFATSFVLIVGDCDGDNRKKVFLFHQEKQVQFPSELEYLDQFIEEYGFRADIDFDSICAV